MSTACRDCSDVNSHVDSTDHVVPAPAEQADTTPELNETTTTTNETTHSHTPSGFNLMHYFNGTTLRNFVGEPNGNVGDRETQRIIANRNFLIRILICGHLIAAILFAGLLIWTIFAYELRLYEWQRNPTQALLFFWLIRVLIGISLNVWSINYHYQRVPLPRVFTHCTKVYELTGWVWVIFSIYFTVLNPRENLGTFSCKMCFFLTWVTIACYVSPMLTCTLMYILFYPVIFYLVRWRHQGSFSPGLQKKAIQMLDVERMDYVLKRIEKGNTKTLSAEDDTASEKTVVTIEGEAAQETAAPDSARSDSPQPASNESTPADHLCAICIMEIGGREKIYVMPCDIRHFFHRECLRKWFKRSRICPICRIDIGDLLKQEKYVILD
ncbi:Ring finger domain family protein [Babesia bovis T2Bo]|uniref:Ring finger domain family protein n=1 Tax=Babesia bovis T2Bo TaxID=484906 RepID=UPI001C36735D|nr:Ring finger domain family protein [Babesia bovis T2Bo]EDO06676.2 Ring finger domain family protein [Babesia bovis T2Bo]